MELRVIATGQVMYESEFRQYLKSINGPSYDVLTPEIMGVLGVDPVFEGPQATPTNHYEYSQRQGVELKNDGKWYTKYVLGPVFTLYTDQEGNTHTVEEQRAAWMSQKDTEQGNNIRTQRTQLLKDSDWTQVADAPVDQAAWAAYRQALRDVPTQAGFPWDIQWPTKPE
jgi:hypothetical protein